MNDETTVNRRALSHNAEHNYLIDLLRFVACCIIIVHHSYLIGAQRPYFFYGGFIFVEFFFILSGYLMMNHISRKEANLAGKNIAAYSLRYTIKKFSRIYPYVIIVTALYYMMILATCNDWSARIQTLFSMPFEMMLLNLSGFGMDFQQSSLWYLSAMLITMPIVAFVALKFNNSFKSFIVYVAPPFLYGMMILNFGHIGAWSDQMVVGLSGLIRGAAGLITGCLVYQLSQKLRSLRLSKTAKVLLTFAEILSLLICIYIAFDFISSSYEQVSVALFTVLFTITFSGQSYTRFLKFRIFGFLGKMSLPLYVCHYSVAKIVGNFFSAYSYGVKLALLFALSFVYASALLIAVEKIIPPLMKQLKKMFIVSDEG